MRRRSARGQSRKSRTARWVAAGLAASAVAAVGAYGAAPTGPSAGARPGTAQDDWGSPPPQTPNPCANTAVLNTVNVEQSRTLCLTSGADKKTVPSGAGRSAIAVYGLGGNDAITATSGSADIHGGTGQDTAWVGDQRYVHWDKKDTERVYDAKGRRIQSVRTVSRPTQYIPPKTPARDAFPLDPGVRCEAFSDGTFKIRLTTRPLLRAFDTLPGMVEFQKVAYTAALYRWDATKKAWVPLGDGTASSYINTRGGWSPIRTGSNPWFWDETYDHDWGTFPENNFWRTYDTLRQASLWLFRIQAADAGYYRVKLAYHWYAAQQSNQTTTVDFPDYNWDQWVKFHDDQSNDKTAAYKKDSYCAFGVDPDIGP